MSTNYFKYFKTIEEQVTYLVNTKNIKNDELIATILEERAYASVINPYKRFFATGKNTKGHEYKEQVDFKNYLSLISLDDELANTLYYWIGIFERKLKFFIAYKISELLNQNNDRECTSYIKIINNYFDNKGSLSDLGFIEIDDEYEFKGGLRKNELNIPFREQVLKRIIKIGDPQNVNLRNTLINHYKKEYKKVPFWLIVHELTLGELNTIFSMLKPTIRRYIYRKILPKEKDKISALKINRFNNYINTIQRLRNVINHYEPLFTYFEERGNHQQLLKTIELLQYVNENSIISNFDSLYPLNINKNRFNQKIIQNMRDIQMIIKRG